MTHLQFGLLQRLEKPTSGLPHLSRQGRTTPRLLSPGHWSATFSKRSLYSLFSFPRRHLPGGLLSSARDLGLVMINTSFLHYRISMASEDPQLLQ